MKKRLFHGPKKRWCDELVSDLHAIGVKDGWHQLCQDRKEWSELCSCAVDVLAQSRGRNTGAANIFSNLGIFYCVCGRHFRRQGDITRHR